MARPRLVSDEAICTTARKSVFEHGPQVSLELIAERLGVSVPALLKRFGSRNALMLAALKFPEHPRFVELLEKGFDPQRPVSEQLKELMEAHMQFLDDAWPCMTALRESGIPKEQLREVMSKGPLFQIVKLLTHWIQQVQRHAKLEGPAPHHLAMVMLGAGQFPVMLRHMAKLLGGAAPNTDSYASTASALISESLQTPKKRRS
jgi:AcrR family transcriptional regulator